MEKIITKRNVADINGYFETWCTTESIIGVLPSSGYQ